MTRLLRHALTGLAAFHVGLLAWLAAVAVLPVLIGWTPYVISSGSMEPRIPVGAVVVAGPPPAEAVAPGGVIVFTDDSGRTVTHRVVEIDEEGRYRTKGDANAVVDPAPVDAEQVRGVGRILVPLVGVPLLWAVQGRWLLFVSFFALTALALWHCAQSWAAGRERRAGAAAVDTGGDAAESEVARDGHAAGQAASRRRRRQPAPPGPRLRRRLARRSRLGDVVPALTLLVGLAAFLGSAAAVTGAAFLAVAEQPTNRWHAAATFTGFLGVTASDLAADGDDIAQTFTFSIVAALEAGESVTIDLTEPYRGPVDYFRAGQPSASPGSAEFGRDRGQSPQRSAQVVWTAPAAGLPAGTEVTIVLPGIDTDDVSVGGLAVTFQRDATADTATATFTVD